MSFAGYTQDQNIEEYIDRNFKIFIENEEFNLSDF
jgi:hypothetical protein